MFRWINRIQMARAVGAHARLVAHGESVLGPRQWALLRRHGKCMAGPPHGGQYVSGMPLDEVHKLLNALAAGETVPIHLMHRHGSGGYDSSTLRLGSQGELVMVYSDREIALSRQ